MNFIQKEIRALKDKKRAKAMHGFFRTRKGEYGQGDVFLGLTVPLTRKIAKKHCNAGLPEVKELLASKFHEERLCSLLILVEKFKKAKENEKQKLFDFYLAHIENVNNWDLVDLSADKIAGEYLFDKDKTILYYFAKSDNLWARRIAIVSTFAFIKKNMLDETLKIAQILMNDSHDLIHKAVGWMLRETGKKNLQMLESFLKKHYKKMPRTMLRYAIERFDEKKRKTFLLGKA